MCNPKPLSQHEQLPTELKPGVSPVLLLTVHFAPSVHAQVAVQHCLFSCFPGTVSMLCSGWKVVSRKNFFDFLDIILSPSQTIEKTEFHGCWCSNRTTSPGLLGDIVQPRTLSAQLACLPWPSSPQIPEAWLLLANVVVILILVPVKDHLIDPLLLQCKLLPSALKKMALGMFFGFTSIIVAGA